MTTPSPTFSYAQAAKGRSPSISATPSSSKSGPDMPETATNTPSSQDSRLSERTEDTVRERRASGGLVEKDKNSEIGHKSDRCPEPDPTQPAEETASQDTTETQALPTPSAPSSPSYGTTSITTLPKDDDVFATPNGSSESTWEKISQTSQNGERPLDKTHEDDEDAKISMWEHVPASAQLKEAPPPAFNIWQKRALDAQAKAKPVQSAGSASPPSKDTVHSLGTKKTLEAAVDTNKGDRRRKSIAGIRPSDEKAGSASVKESARSGDERIPYRNTRSPELSRSAVDSAPPPPPGDSISWPTPDIAQEEEKKRHQDRSDKGEKEKSSASKPHGKEKWVTVPYVPSAVFNTPLPPSRRGGRSSRGGKEASGRGGHMAHSSVSGERPAVAQTNSTASNVVHLERSRGNMDLPRGGSLAFKPKRASSAGPPPAREHRRNDTVIPDRHSDAVPVTQRPIQNSRPQPIDSRRTSAATQTDISHSGRQESPPRTVNDFPGRRRFSSNNTERDREQSISPQDHAHPRTTPDRRSEGSMRPPDLPRDSHSFMISRERGEGRAERGRGGFRGRGGHNGFNNHSTNGQNFANGQHNNTGSQGFAPSKSQSYEARHGIHPQAPPFAPQRDSRSYRPTSRSQSIPNPNGFGRYPNGVPPGGSQHLPALQTDLANIYGYHPVHSGVMSALPYQPYMEQMHLLGMVQMQIEYYFSIDNLLKDMFLRKQMDSQGFVFLSVIVKFNRIRQLTSDIDLIRYVCKISPTIELQTGLDGVDRVRKVEGWQQWVLNKDERDAAAQNDGPAHMQQAQMPQGTSWESVYRGPNDSQAPGPRHSFPNSNNMQDVMNFQSTNRIPSSRVDPSPDRAPTAQVVDKASTPTPLSAAVPDFTPSLQPVSSWTLSPLDAQAQRENSFSDEQIESLMIVIRKPASSTTVQRTPFNTSIPRTFSNGVNEGRTVSEELDISGDRRLSCGINDDIRPEHRAPEVPHSSRSPFAFGSAPRQPSTSSPPVFWVKDKETPIEDLPQDLTHESYTIFRHNALKQREQTPKGQCHRDMDILFQFWSHFLIRNFNTSMYDEFRTLAFDDTMHRDSDVGIRNLVAYYDESILGQKVITDDLARDYVNLVKAEISKKDRLAFDKLRSAWRNGALNLKNRIKIDKILDTDLKAELER